MPHIDPILETLSDLGQIDHRSILDKLCSTWLLASPLHAPEALRLLISCHSSRKCTPTDGMLKLCDLNTKSALPMCQYDQVSALLATICSAAHQHLEERQVWLEALAPLLMPWLKLATLLPEEAQNHVSGTSPPGLITTLTWPV